MFILNLYTNIHLNNYWMHNSTSFLPPYITPAFCSYCSICTSNIEIASDYSSVLPAVDDLPPQHSIRNAIGASSYSNLSLTFDFSLPTLANTPFPFTRMWYTSGTIPPDYLSVYLRSMYKSIKSF